MDSGRIALALPGAVPLAVSVQADGKAISTA